MLLPHYGFADCARDVLYLVIGEVREHVDDE